MPRISKKAAAVAAAVAIVAVGAGSAYAYWTTTGTGNGTASTSGGASNLAITQTAAPTNLAPGVAAGTISGTVKNNAGNSAYVNSVTVSIASVTAPNVNSTTSPCDASDYVLSNPVMSVTTDIAAGSTANFTGATLAFNDKAGNQDGCKGATVNLAYASN